MRFDFTTEPAEFLERPNRYLVMARLARTGETIRAHCPDPGRLRELLIPGVTVHVSRASGPQRRTTHTLRFVNHPESGQLVSLDSCLANRLWLEALEAGIHAAFADVRGVEREVTLPTAGASGIRSRIDFRLTDSDGRISWVEVKSATLVEGDTAYFPDAVTERGRRHVHELAGLARAGDRAAVCFVVQRPDACCLRPQWDRDPAFAQALCDAAGSGVELRACSARVSLAEAAITREIPVLPERYGWTTAAAGL